MFIGNFGSLCGYIFYAVKNAYVAVVSGADAL